MGKLKQQTFDVETPDGPQKFTLQISVNAEGEFSTYLPEELNSLLESAGIYGSFGRGEKRGYFHATTLNNLLASIRTAIEEYESLKLVESKIVLEYVIQTQCSYCLNLRDEIVPNGSFEWTGTKDYKWKEGTIHQYAQEPHPYGFLIYVAPYVKDTFLRKSGVEVIKKRRITTNNFESEFGEDKPELNWLVSVCAMAPPMHAKTSEIDYTESVAKFFVEMIKGVCRLNERIKDFLHPEAIKFLADSRIKLLEG